jgi:hypothetical protein
MVTTATWHEAVASLKMKHMEESFSRYESVGYVANFAQAVLEELPVVPLCRGDTAYPTS